MLKYGDFEYRVEKDGLLEVAIITSHKPKGAPVSSELIIPDFIDKKPVVEIDKGALDSVIIHDLFLPKYIVEIPLHLTEADNIFSIIVGDLTTLIQGEGDYGDFSKCKFRSNTALFGFLKMKEHNVTIYNGADADFLPYDDVIAGLHPDLVVKHEGENYLRVGSSSVDDSFYYAKADILNSPGENHKIVVYDSNFDDSGESNDYASIMQAVMHHILLQLAMDFTISNIFSKKSYNTN